MQQLSSTPHRRALPVRRSAEQSGIVLLRGTDMKTAIDVQTGPSFPGSAVQPHALCKTLQSGGLSDFSNTQPRPSIKQSLSCLEEPYLPDGTRYLKTRAPRSVPQLYSHILGTGVWSRIKKTIGELCQPHLTSSPGCTAWHFQVQRTRTTHASVRAERLTPHPSCPC